MLDAAVKALSQILSPPMRTILWRSIGLALVLITVLAIGLQRVLSWFATYGEGWAEAMLGPNFHTPLNLLAWVLSIAAGLGVASLPGLALRDEPPKTAGGVRGGSVDEEPLHFIADVKPLSKSCSRVARVQRQLSVGQRLGFNALAGVDDQ